MLIFGTNLEVVNTMKKFMSSKFDIKDLREVDVILEIKILITSNGLMLN